MLPIPIVWLTPVQPGPREIAIEISRLITYAQERDFNRVRLTGGKTVDVKETTDHIDRLVRSAATR